MWEDRESDKGKSPSLTPTIPLTGTSQLGVCREVGSSSPRPGQDGRVVIGGGTSGRLYGPMNRGP